MQAIGEDASNPALFTNRSTCLFAMQRYEDSLADAQRAVGLDGQWVKGFYRIGLTSIKLEKFRQAKEAAEKGLQIEVNNAQLKDILSQATAELAKLPSDYKDAKVVPRVA